MSGSLLANRKYFGFLLLWKSVTLNDLERSRAALSPFCDVFFSWKTAGLGANYAKLA